jgi:apolipoprotein N-acyltransferase
MQVFERISPRALMHQVPSAVPQPSRLPWPAQASLAMTASALMWAGFFPLNQGWVAWFALAPLLGLVRSPAVTMRSLLLISYASGFAFFLMSLKWMRVAHPMMWSAWIALAFYCALYFPLGVWILRRIDRAMSLPFTLTLPVVWTALEFLRAHFLTGFPWYFTGLTQHDYLPVIQIADLGGVYAVSFLVLAGNGLIFELINRLKPVQSLLHLTAGGSRTRLALQTAAVALAVAGSLGYGYLRLSEGDFGPGPRVALLQSNVEQGVRNARHDEGEQAAVAMDEIVQHTKDLTDQILRERQYPDLIIWPETTFAQDWVEAVPGTPANELPPDLAVGRASRENLVKEVATYSHAPVLLGLNTLEFSRGLERRRYNSALLVHKDEQEFLRYDKFHRVLFGEYVPLRETMPWLSNFTPYDHDYSLSAGQRWTRFRLRTERGEFRFGVLICYEDSISPLARHYVQPEPNERPVDFLVNMSNDGWFDGTEEHEEHLAVCRFRAVETRRAVARAVNMGISGIIDGNGRVVALPAKTWGDSKKVAAAFTATVPIDTRTSFYGLAGDWFAAGCSALTVMGFLGTIVLRRAKVGA